MNDKVLQIIIKAKDEASKVLAKVDSTIKKQSKSWEDMGRAISNAGMVITAASATMAGALASTIPAWHETRQAQLAFENTVKNMPQLVDTNIDAWYEWVAAMEMKLAVDDAEINNMASMLGTYGMTEQQMRQLIPVITDLSRKYGIDLASATKYVGYALQGNTGMLKRYGIALDLSAAKTEEGIDVNKAFELTLQQLSQAVGGYSESLDKEGMLATQRFQLAMGNLKETIGKVVWETLTPFIEKVNELIVKFNNLNTPITQTIAKVTLFTTGLGLVAGPIMMVIGNLGKLASVLSGLINPWTLVIGVVGSFTVHLYNTNEAFREMVNTVISRAMEMIQYIINNFPFIVDTVQNTFQNVLRTAYTILTPFIELVQTLMGQIITWTQNNWPLIQQTVETVMNAIRTVVETVLGWLRTFWEEHGEKIKSIASFIWDKVKVIIETTLDTILGIIKAIMLMINGDWEGAWNTMKEVVSNIGRTIIDILKDMWNDIVSGIRAALPAIIEALEAIGQAMKDYFVNLAKQALEWGKNLIKNFIDGIKSMMGKLSEAVDGAGEAIGTKLGIHSPAKEGPLSDADKWMPNLINMMATQLEQGRERISRAAEKVAKELVITREPVNTLHTPMSAPTVDVSTGINNTSNQTGDMADAIYQAVVKGFETMGLTGGNKKGEMVLQIDGQSFARVIYDYLIAEGQRRGVEVIPT